MDKCAITIEVKIILNVRKTDHEYFTYPYTLIPYTLYMRSQEHIVYSKALIKSNSLLIFPLHFPSPNTGFGRAFKVTFKSKSVTNAMSGIANSMSHVCLIKLTLKKKGKFVLFVVPKTYYYGSVDLSYSLERFGRYRFRTIGNQVGQLSDYIDVLHRSVD